MTRRDATRANRADDERGLTLPELVVAVVLMGLVFSGIATALVQGLSIPMEGRARSMAATNRTVAITTLSDDIANATKVETLKDGTAIEEEYRVDSKCTSSTTPERLFRLTDGDDVTIEYRLQYSAYRSDTSAVELQRDVDAEDKWETMIAGYCRLSPEPDVVLDVLTITSGADEGASEIIPADPDDPLSEEKVLTPFYINRRLRAEFKFRDTPEDQPTLVNIEAAPRTDCRSKDVPRGYLDPELPACEHVEVEEAP